MMREIIKQFGIPTVSLKPILKELPKIFDHKDKNVREEAGLLSVEIFRWIGNDLVRFLGDIKPVQVL